MSDTAGMPSSEQQESEQKRGFQLNQNFVVRILTSLVLVPLAIFVLFVGGALFNIFVLALIALSMLEMLAIINNQQLHPRMLISLALLLLVAYAFPQGQTALWAGALLLGLPLIALLERAAGHAVRRILITLLVTLYMTCAAAFAIYLRALPAGLLVFLLITAGTWAMDTMSYAGGRRYGHTKLAPRLSPKKTVEGAVTGVIGSVAISLAILARVDAIVPLTVLLALCTPFVALAGDLLLSGFKRTYGVKDSHLRGFNIVPGHGGMVDRLDSILLVVLFYFTAIYLLA